MFPCNSLIISYASSSLFGFPYILLSFTTIVSEPITVLSPAVFSNTTFAFYMLIALIALLCLSFLLVSRLLHFTIILKFIPIFDNNSFLLGDADANIICISFSPLLYFHLHIFYHFYLILSILYNLLYVSV